MYVLVLHCDQGQAYAWNEAACTDRDNARRFNGVVDAVTWLFNHVVYLNAIGARTFELVKA